MDATEGSIIINESEKQEIKMQIFKNSDYREVKKIYIK